MALTNDIKLEPFLTGIANAIRTKEESTDMIDAVDFAQRILNIPSKVSQSGLSFTSCEKINNDWKFCLIGDEASDAGYDGTKQQQALSNVFTSVNLPHDWSIYNNFKSTSKSTYEGGYLDGGEAWYKKNISIDKDDDARYFLYFEGVYMESDVLLNGVHINTHKNGYTNFIVELTNGIVDGDNELLVYVKNRQPSSRWYSGSGIYRDVFLIKTGAIGIKQQSVVITTPDLENEIKDNYCTTKVKYTLENTTSETSTVSVESIFKYYGEEIAKKKSNITINANATLTQNYDCIIADPKLWDEYDGRYYTLEMNVYNSDGDLISNSVSYYGYRWFKFDKDTGFWLNGKNIKLRGACMHHDLGCLGAEINQSAIDRQIKSLKEAGFNAIRLTHNPSCAEFTNACMRMGMMCIEEAFDCWTVSKKTYDYARFFMTYAESDLKSMIKRSINNPCVIAWSIGNEIYDTKSNYSSRVLQNPVETATQLKTWVYETDATRPVTMGENGIYDSIAKSVADVMDVVGLNYTAYSQRRSGLPVYGSETTSALSSRCVYEHDATNYQCSSYDDDKVSWGSYAYAQIADMNKYAYCGGMFIWTGWDYIGEPTPFNKYPARSSYFGCVDIAGFPKDSYYLYQSMWTEKPMCHIVPMDWSKWTVGEDVNIMVYSNAHHVKMYLNGSLVGTYNNKTMESTSKGSFYGTIPFAKGRLVANAYDANDNLIAQDVIYTQYQPKKIKLTSDKLYYKNSEDLLFIEVDICDNENHICTMADNSVVASVDGGTVIGIDNGDATSVLKYRSNSKPVFHGKAVCVVRPNNNSSNVSIAVTSDGLTSDTIVIQRSDMTVYYKSDNEFIDATETYVYTEEEKPCTSLSVDTNILSLNSTTGTHQIVTTVEPTDTTDVISYNSDNQNVAIVSSSGNITAVNNGECIITVTCGSQVSEINVTVSEITVDCTSLTLSDTSVTLTDTSQHDMTVTVLPSNCTYEPVWESTDTNVVVVDNGGHYTAVASGNAEIVVTCGSQTARCSVNVELEAEEEDPAEFKKLFDTGDNKAYGLSSGLIKKNYGTSLAIAYQVVPGNEYLVTLSPANNCKVYLGNDDPYTLLGGDYGNGSWTPIPDVEYGGNYTGNIGPITATSKYMVILTKANVEQVTVTENGTPVPVTLSSISAVKTKTTYVIGDTVNVDDIVVTANYSNNTHNTVDGYTLSPSVVDTSVEGDKTITISYTEDGVTKTTTIVITIVGAIELSSITASKTKKKYNVGDDYSDDDITVTANYTDGTSNIVTDFEVQPTTVDTSTAGTTQLTISYTENSITKTAVINISVVEPSGWDYEWNGEDIPEYFVESSYVNVGYDDVEDKKYFTTSAASSEASLTFGDSDTLIPFGVSEMDFKCSSYTKGKGWNMGLEVIPSKTTQSMRAALYTIPNKDTLMLNNNSTVIVESLPVDEMITLRIDTTENVSDTGKAVRVVVLDSNGNELHNTRLDNRLMGTGVKTSCNKIYTNNPDCRIYGYRIKLDGREVD